MPEFKRRELLAAGAVGGLAMAESAIAQDKPKDEQPKNKPFDLADEKRSIMGAGLTDSEADCWAAIADAAKKFFDLPKLHPMDDHEVAQAIHVVQNKLLGRPTYRKYLEAVKNRMKS